MVGSDQLWAPGGITSNFYNLMFADENTTKISYAASFGVSQIEEKMHPLYKKFLDRMDYISVRENSGKSLWNSSVQKLPKLLLILFFYSMTKNGLKKYRMRENMMNRIFCIFSWKEQGIPQCGNGICKEKESENCYITSYGQLQ